MPGFAFRALVNGKHGEKNSTVRMFVETCNVEKSGSVLLEREIWDSFSPFLDGAVVPQASEKIMKRRSNSGEMKVYKQISEFIKGQVN